MLQMNNTIRRVEKWVAHNLTLLRQHRERRAALQRPAEYWQRLDERLYDEIEPVFFLSTGRCGTELLTTIFQRIPGIHCYHEPFPVLVSTETKAYRYGKTQFESFKMAIHAARFELIADCAIRGRRYIETNHRLTFLAPQLYEMFPKARFIHLVRHPGSFVRSGVSRGYYQGQYTDLGRITPYCGPAAETWPTMSPFERCAWLWNETNSFAEDFKKGRSAERILTVKSENLFKDPAVTAAILAHCGMPAMETRDIQRAIARPVNAQARSNQLPPYSAWEEGTKDEVRRWTPLAAFYEYKM